MKPAHVVEIVTPKKFVLNGLWFGPKKPKRAIIWIHGLSSSAFSKLDIVEKLVDSRTAVMTFNNRGHSNVARIAKVSGKKSLTAGAAYERFEDCIDDIQGAINFTKKAGAKDIYLAGHSTGCQKAAYWAYKNGRGVKGVILLAPMSDYAGAVKKYGLPKIRHMQSMARAMLKNGRDNEIVRSKFWTDEPDSPRRFLSLYTPDSVEQSIFSYFEPSRPAKVLAGIRLPVLSILAENDEYADRPAQDVVTWFENHARSPLVSLVIKDARHSFRGHGVVVIKAIKTWIK
jgi:pimeloyl-ACP methyl ester carboxylesterase